jgi:hypothetical protein
MNNEELILGLVREIHDDQKDVVKAINELTIAHTELRAELEASRNGYSPHEVVRMLHWIDEQMRKQQEQNSNIKNAFISWLVPILSSAVVAGLVVLVTKGII